MRVSVAICTWNRACLLERTLGSFRDLQVPEGLEWELVVVDNASTDSTAQVIEQASSCLPVRRVYEPQQGHSRARNAAIDAVRGELMLWTDDDVRVDSQWLQSLVSASERQPEVAFWGGTILPEFETEPPRWVAENWEMASNIYALRDWKAPVERVEVSRMPFGANFAIRSEAQRRFRYDVEFGRKGHGMRGFDEVDVFRRMLDAGLEGAWCVEAKVHHFIPRDRLNLEYVRRYFQGQGETLVVRGESQQSDWTLRRRERLHRFWYAMRRWWRPSCEWMPHLIEASRVAGQLRARAILRQEGRVESQG